MGQSSLFTHLCQTHITSSPKCQGAPSISVLDLRDAFFCIPLHPDSQHLLHLNGGALTPVTPILWLPDAKK